MSLVLPITLPGQPGGQVEMTFDVFGFGATPAIEPPPSDDAFDATELSKQILDAETG